jgi:hypothetical protein
MSEKAEPDTVDQLRARILEWEDCYDRLAGAFELHMDILECKQALIDLAGTFYDVAIGELARRAERAEADAATLRAALLRCYDQWTPPVPDWLIEAAMGRTGQQAMGVVCAALAERAELEAARAVVKDARLIADSDLLRLIGAYDEAVKGRQA